MPGQVFTEVLQLAGDRHGFVRASDLREAGLDPKRLNDYHRRGLADHLGYGIYRLTMVPPGQWDEYMLAAIWPDGRGVLSHETALDVHELCDVNPNHIDVTVPMTYRTHRETPDAYRLHRADLRADEITRRAGLPIVTPARAIADSINAGLRPSLIDQALATAEREALITAEVARDLRQLHNQVRTR